jgi:hydrogenase maturation factor
MPENALKRSILKGLSEYNGRSGAKIGADAGFYENCGKSFMMSTAALFGNDDGNGELSVIRAVNSMAAAGGKALAASLSLAVPPEEGESFAKKVMGEAVRGCKKCGIELISGNTLVGDCAFVSVAVTGEKVFELRSPEKDRNRILIMTGYAGNAGAAMLARKKYDALAERLTGEFIKKAMAGSDDTVCFEKAFELAKACDGAISMHDISEGGVFGALWELLEREKAGCSVDLRSIPIRQTAVEVCEILDVSPYTLRGDGGLIAVVEDTPDNRKLGTVIGRVEDTADRVILNGEEKRFLEPNRHDGYYEI